MKITYLFAVALTAMLATPVLAQDLGLPDVAVSDAGPAGYGQSYNDGKESGYVARNDFIARTGTVCHPGSVIRDETGARTVCR